MIRWKKSKGKKREDDSYVARLPKNCFGGLARYYIGHSINNLWTASFMVGGACYYVSSRLPLKDAKAWCKRNLSIVTDRLMNCEWAR